MVVIRLTRGGAKHRPFYTIVVTDRRNARDGRFIEKLGFHNPIANDRQEKTRINEERLNYWLSKGAQMSMTVRRLCRQTGVKFIRPGESLDNYVPSEKPAVEKSAAEKPAAEQSSEADKAEG